MTIEHANAMPAATWHFLKMNDVEIEIPPALVTRPLVRERMTGDVPPFGQSLGALDEAVRLMRAEWAKTHPEPTEQERAERAAVLAAEADATYGGTAQSTYQINADAIEELRSLAISPDGGMGAEADAYLAHAANEHVAVVSKPNGRVDAQVLVSAKMGLESVAAIDVVAAEGSAVNLTIAVDSSDEPGESSGAEIDEGSIGVSEAAAGVAGTFVRVFAGKGASVDIVRTQTLDDGFIDLDDMALLMDNRSRVTVRQSVLGADVSYAGLAGDLRGDAAVATVDTRYLGHGDQKRDFNYVLRHHGRRTQCNLNANGVLAGDSRKTLRGTIDFIRGCKGAEGSENETVLLVDEGVQNKTIPVILCNEDDVAGNHGATIGHVREEQLFYLASRGLSQKAAEEMFVLATLEQAAIDAPDDVSRAGVVRLGEKLKPGFENLMEA